VIRMRDDDVLVPSRSWASPFGRFRQLHEWIRMCPGMVHVPTLIIEELKAFPECIEYLQYETDEGHMLPEFHGMWHVNYAALPEQHVREHLDEGCEWILHTFRRRPTTWYTPWGSTQEHLQKLAAEFGLTLVGVDREWNLDRVCARLRTGSETPETLQGHEILFHWWEGGARVGRVAHTVKHGSWEAAAKAEPELF
jgi:hypothetical protein